MSRRYSRKSPAQAAKRGRPALPRWPEIHPRFHRPEALSGVDHLAYELAQGHSDSEGREAHRS